MPAIITNDRAAAGGPGRTFALASKLTGVPLYMSEAHGHKLRGALENRAFDAPGDALAGVFGSKFIGTYDARSRFRVTDDGIALVAVGGILLDRGPWLGDLYGLATTYEGLAEQVQRLAKDNAIKSVVLDIDSGGGMVAGLYDLAEELGKLAKAKPLYAIAQNFAASAAYAIACTADEVYVTRNGEAGSIGVISIHQSYGRMLDDMGVDTTIICEPAPKADGNPFTALSHGARAEISAGVADAYQQFVAHVARHRGLKEDDVRATQARLYSGEKAVEAGLADGVKSIEELLAHIRKGAARASKRPARSAARATTKQGGAPMGSNANQPGEGADYDTIIADAMTSLKESNTALAAALKASTPAAPAAPAADPAAAPAAAAPAAGGNNPAAADDQRSRVKAILDSEPAKDRPGLAKHLALETDIDAATSVKILGLAAPEKSGGNASNFYAAVAATGGNPKVGHSGGNDGPPPSRAQANIERQKTRFAGAR